MDLPSAVADSTEDRASCSVEPASGRSQVAVYGLLVGKAHGKAWPLATAAITADGVRDGPRFGGSVRMTGSSFLKQQVFREAGSSRYYGVIWDMGYETYYIVRILKIKRYT